MNKLPRLIFAAFGVFTVAYQLSCAGGGAAPAAASNPPPLEKGLPIFAFLYRAGPAWQAGKPMREQGLGPHGKYIKSLLESGRLFAGGGFSDVEGGLALVRAADLEEARGILAADPAITSGIFVADIHRWHPRFVTPEPLRADP